MLSMALHYIFFSFFFYQELRDENDELRLQCEALTQQVNSSVKRRSSHRKRQDSQKVHRHGSLLSDYTKPVVIKRNKEGVTSSDESDTADQPDGTRVPSVRVSGDGGSNEDAGKLQNRCARKFSRSHMLCSLCAGAKRVIRLKAIVVERVCCLPRVEEDAGKM